MEMILSDASHFSIRGKWAQLHSNTQLGPVSMQTCELRKDGMFHVYLFCKLEIL